MKLKRYIALVLLIFGIGMGISIHAQEDDAECPAIITQALELAHDYCDNLGRNVACYGNNQVIAQFIQDSTAQAFSEPADTAPLAEVVSISTSALNVEQNIWGLALMNVQANIPDTIPGQAVLFFLMGETQIENRTLDIPEVVPVDVTITASDRVNIRSGAGSNFNVLGAVSPNSIWSAMGVSDDGAWVQIDYNDTVGWVSRSLIRPTDTVAFANLPIGGNGVLSPMQAFYFTTGTGIPACKQAPDAIVVQSPERLSVRLNINGATVNIGSTIVLQTVLENGDTPTPAPDNECKTTQAIVLDGELIVNSGQTTIPIGHAASFTACPDDTGEFIPQDDWQEDGIVSEERLEEFAQLEDLPDGMLHYPIRIPTREDIERALRPTQTPPPDSPDARPTDETRPRATPTPRPSTSGVDCSGFFAISPTDAVVWGMQEFRWSPAVGADFYYVTVERRDGLPGSVVISQTGGGAQSLFIDMGLGSLYQLGRASNVAWRVEAWGRDANGQAYPACEAASVVVRRSVPNFGTICNQLNGIEITTNYCVTSEEPQVQIVIPD